MMLDDTIRALECCVAFCEIGEAACKLCPNCDRKLGECHGHRRLVLSASEWLKRRGSENKRARKA